MVRCLDRFFLEIDRLPKTHSAENTITVTTAASLFEKSPRWLQQLVAGGYVEKPVRGRYDLKATISGVVAYYEARLKDCTRSAAANRASEARTREIELRIAERTRNLIPAEDARAVVMMICTQVKSELLGMPARLSRDVDTRRKIEAEVDAALHRIADAADRAAADPEPHLK